VHALRTARESFVEGAPHRGNFDARGQHQRRYVSIRDRKSVGESLTGKRARLMIKPVIKPVRVVGVCSEMTRHGA
jgi:hypothetical protein